MKLLFFSHDGKLGDCVVNTAFVAGLRAHAPGAEIHATVAGASAAFWARDARLHTLWPLTVRTWKAILSAGLALRRQRFDVIVTWRPMRSEKNRLLLWLARPGRVIDLADFHRQAPLHQLECCRAALRQMGANADGALAYDVAAARCPELDAMLPAGREILVLNLFAADRERTVTVADGVALLRGLRRLAPDAALCLVCSGATAAVAQEVLREADAQARLLDCEGSLERLIDLCARADLLISPDTALIHLASAFDTPVIGIYQNDGCKALRWGPRSQLQALVLAPGADGIAGFSVAAVLEHAAALRARHAPGFRVA